jgi:hypothetical protein
MPTHIIHSRSAASTRGDREVGPCQAHIRPRRRLQEGPGQPGAGPAQLLISKNELLSIRISFPPLLLI